MKKKTVGMIRYSAVCVLILLFCVLIGRMTAKSYKNNTRLDRYLSNPDLVIAYYGMGYDSVTNRGYLDNEKIQSVDDLLLNDVVVVKATLAPNAKREIYYECILSRLEIVECYHGNLRAGDGIYCFEPADCGFTEQILCADGYSMMQEDKEYILFLKTLKNTYFGSDDYVYAPISTVYAKYPVDQKIPKLFTYEELEEPEHLHLYEQMKDQEIYLYDRKEYDKYLELKKEVLKRYGKIK